MKGWEMPAGLVPSRFEPFVQDLAEALFADQGVRAGG